MFYFWVIHYQSYDTTNNKVLIFFWVFTDSLTWDIENVHVTLVLLDDQENLYIVVKPFIIVFLFILSISSLVEIVRLSWSLL